MLDCCPGDGVPGNQGSFAASSAGSTNSSLSDSLPASFLAMDQTRQTAFMLNNSPLAALHNMTEMKVPVSGASCGMAAPYTSQASQAGSGNASIKNPYLGTAGSHTNCQLYKWRVSALEFVVASLNDNLMAV